MKYIFYLFLSFFLIQQGFGQELPDISTDRPDQSESSATVPKGTLQAEAGFVYQGDKEQTTYVRNLNYLGLFLRYGIFDNLEVRLGMNVAGVTRSPDDGSPDTTFSGFVPLIAGLKIYVTEQQGAIPEMSFLGSVTIPNTGSKDFDILNLAGDLRMALGWSISDHISAGGNIGVQWNTYVPGGSGFYSFVTAFRVAPPVTAFVEVYGWLPESQLPDHRADAGLVFRLRKNLQVDVSGGIGLSAVSPDFFLNTGIAWRIPR